MELYLVYYESYEPGWPKVIFDSLEKVEEYIKKNENDDIHIGGLIIYKMKLNKEGFEVL